jgi:hypothetical protein
VKAVGQALLGAWRRIIRLVPSRAEDRATRRERRYLGAKAAERAERARQARDADRPRDMTGGMGGGAGYGSG